MRTIFMGTGEIGLPAFNYLLSAPECDLLTVVTQPDKPAGRKRELKPSPIKSAALAAGLPVLQPSSLRKPEIQNTLQELAPDLIVVMAFGQILPREVLDLPTLACLNLHASLLPKFRGASPINAAIEAGESETGISVMFMAEGLDTGDVVLTESTKIKRRETAGSLHDRLALVAASSLKQAIAQLMTETITRYPQDNSLASYAGRLSRADGALDWRQSAIALERKIRAMNPWPAAWTTIPVKGHGSREIKIFSAIIHRRTHGNPGEILRSDHRGVLIACGDGALLLREIQMEGRRKMLAGEWQLGAPVAVESIVGGSTGEPS